MDEFELTYLPKQLPENLNDCVSKEMLDIYLPASSDHPHLRIRKSGTTFEITNKQPAKETDSSHQIEKTVQLTHEEFADLEVVPGKRVYKTRYLYKEQGVLYEIDVFGGELKGLVLVDVEFNSSGDKDSFKAPEWLLAEVTQEKFIAGGVLAGKKFAEIEEDLKKFGYTKLV